jgi:hypothetical protein
MNGSEEIVACPFIVERSSWIQAATPGGPEDVKDVSHMALLLFLIVLAAVAVLAPLLGKDTSASARYEDRPDDRAWWPAGPDALPRPRF